MRAQKFALIAAGLLGLAGCFGQAPGGPDALARDFQNPPASARPRVWWHWMNGNVTREGIQRDLEWMKRVGIGGFQNFDAELMTPKVVDKRLAYMTPEWKEAFRYAATLADELGLEMAIASSPGWSETGGPWVKPAQALKKLVWSELRVPGGQPFSGTLPHPPEVTGPFQGVPFQDEMISLGQASKPPQHYADSAVVAYRLPASEAPAKACTFAASSGAIDGALLTDGDLARGVQIPLSAQGAWLQCEFPAPTTIHAVTLARPPAAMFATSEAFRFSLESSANGRAWTRVSEIPVSRVAQETVAFAPATAKFFRLAVAADPAAASFGGFEAAPGVDLGAFAMLAGGAGGAKPVQINEFVLHQRPRIHRFEEKAGFGLVRDYYTVLNPSIDSKLVVKPADVVDLTRRMKPDGTLDWTPPAGQWVILRLGYSLTGKTNHPATKEATGLEVDKLDAKAVRSYIDTYLGMYQETLGPQLMGRRGVKALLTDSIEVGAYNWTPELLAQFKRLRGYDAAPYLPALTGVVVGSAEQSDAFLWDFRRTLSQLTALSHYGEVAKAARERGLTLYGESLEGTRVSMGDDMEMRQHADIPMSAMWTYPPGKGPRTNYVIDIQGAASVAHIYGQNLVAAESMTSAMVPWGFSPRSLKPIMDLEFALGVNRPVIHTSVHQPVEKKPGLGLLIFGQYFNRHETWAEQAGPWVTYLARNAHLLQQGRFAADVAYFYGEEAPLAGLFGEGSSLPADVPLGYGYDFVNSDVLLNRLSVSGGNLVTASGMSYRLLYLGGSSQRMTLPVLRKLRDLVGAGATVVGSRPVASPSLADDAKEFAALVEQLWGAQGKVRSGAGVNAVLASLGVEPDFDYTGSGAQRDLLFLHRRLADGDLYFLSNRQDQPRQLDAVFRVAGKAAELWHADSGLIEPVSYSSSNGRTTVPLRLAAHESVFVVFRKPAAASASVATEQFTALATLDGAWDVRFDPTFGGPAKTTFSQLTSWAENGDAGVKYYSGTAAYTKTVDVPGAWLAGGRRLVLDLGEVRELAEVVVNGTALGIAWHPPYQVDVTSALKAGTNTLEVRVTNLWVNRLIGDKQPGAKPYTFTVMATYKADATPLPSGLLGPVRVLQSAR